MILGSAFAHAGGADLHQHPTMRESVPLFRGEPGEGVLATDPADPFTNQLEAAQLLDAGIGLVIASVFPPSPTRPNRTALTSALHQLDELERFVLRRPDFVLARSVAEIEAAKRKERVVLLPAIEGGEGIRSVEDVDVLYAAGARSITLVHFLDTQLGGAHVGQVGGLLPFFLEGDGRGLTPLGREVVLRMISLGVLVDVAHANDQTIADVLDLTEPRGVPVIFSHAGNSTYARDLSAASAARIARGGGLIGVGIFRGDMLAPIPEEERWEGFVERSCDELVAHWLHFQRHAGAEAVMLGSDLDSTVQRPLPGGLCPSGLRHAGDLPELFRALISKGVPPSSLHDSEARLLRVLRAVERAADPDARARARKVKRPVEDLFFLPF